MKNLLLLFLLLPAFCTSQNECSIETTTDEFTNEQTTATGFITLETPMTKGSNISYSTKLKLAERNGAFFLLAQIKVASVSSVDQGETFYIKFDDDEVMELYNAEYYVTDLEYSLLLKEDEKILRLGFPLSKNELGKLAEKQISKCRLRTSKGNILVEPQKKHRRYFMSCANEFKKAISN